MQKEFELVDNVWRVSVTPRRLSRPVRIFALFAALAGTALLFVVLFQLGVSANAGNEQSLELMVLLILFLFVATQHFIFRAIVPEQYRFTNEYGFRKTSYLLSLSWVAYFIIISLILFRLGGAN
ncbi:hypothetical protein [Thioclava electrotropha]|uniref:Uncharacterized protein n=1 Tax=Thioclava electrotropha TaxID=1549850 RepID=A0ABX6YS91_9RHOB|nr:hypothetical protein [Thioclava electrotropha]QPZ90717.1 hypothetical protein AKL02_007235 [Thioclava electrotropha]